MNTMVVQGKPEMMTHIPHHHQHMKAGMVAIPGSPMQHPGLTHPGMVGLNGETNHVKRPMNAFMVSTYYTLKMQIFFLLSF